jgi:uncharacterized protein YkwD
MGFPLLAARMNTRKILCIAVVALAYSALPAVPAAASPRACEAAGARPSKANGRAVVRATLCLLNAQRARYGLRPLRVDRRLSKAARRHSRDMARNDYFDHTSRSGASFVDRIRKAGYLRGARRWALAENIAWGGGRRATPRSIAGAWMNSPGHRANILSASHREIGIGVARGTPVGGASSGATYTTDFGARG